MPDPRTSLPHPASAASEDALRACELHVGLQLPADLRRFLRVSDGSQALELPTGQLFRVHSLAEIVEFFDIAVDATGFDPREVAIATDVDASDYVLCRDAPGIFVTPRVPDYIVPIADSFDALVDLLLGGDDPWAREDEAVTSFSYDKLHGPVPGMPPYRSIAQRP